jgi:hypothetical protein
MYLCDTIDVILKVATDCVNILKMDGITKIGNIVIEPICNPGAMIFLDMCELHKYKFGLFTEDVVNRFSSLVVDELKRNIEHIEPYKVNKLCSITHNVIMLLDTIIRLLIQYDTRYYLI